MSVTGLLVLTMPAAALAVSAAPVADFVSPVLGRGVGTLITLCVVIGAFGALNGWVLVVGEVPAAMADHGLLPAWWGKRNARGAAMNSVLVSGVLACVLIMLNGSPRLTNMYTFVLLLSTTTTLALYLLAPVAALVLAYRGTVPRTPALLLASAGAIAFACFAFAGAGLEANLWGLLLIFAGVPLHLYMQRRAPPGRSVRGLNALAQRRPADLRQLEVGEAKGDADHRETEGNPCQHVANEEPQTGEHDPEHVGEARPHDAILTDGARVHERATEGKRREWGHPKRRDRPRDAHDRDRKEEARQQPAKPREESAAQHEPEKIAEESHSETYAREGDAGQAALRFSCAARLALSNRCTVVPVMSRTPRWNVRYW
jgi:hypothetical protein